MNIAAQTQTTPETAIKIRGLQKIYGKLEAVKGIDLDIKQGEIYGLIGPDGAGKTSTFQILGGVMPETRAKFRSMEKMPAKHVLCRLSDTSL